MKKFVFGNAEQLKAIAPLIKDGRESSIMNVARVWNVASRQKGKPPWDGKIIARFQAEGRERKACVLRIGMNDKESVIVWLKYNPALRWCRDNLESLQ